ncbi:hypothetical protein [Sphingomonas sp. CLY1604]|uniref:hypothetical protein n=1 Tax=Sphingomonas sp. CLY1604 TaxID=3457786 RepID=UPI003FD871BA
MMDFASTAAIGILPSMDAESAPTAPTPTSRARLSDVSTATAWLRDRWRTPRLSDVTIAGALLPPIWFALASYVGIFGVSTSEGLDVEPVRLALVAAVCAFALLVVLAFFSLPRFMENGVEGPISALETVARCSACAGAMLLSPWFDFATVLAITLLPLLYVTARRTLTDGRRISPISAVCKDMPRQALDAFLTISWLVEWTTLWIHAWFVENAPFTPSQAGAVFVGIVAAGSLVQIGLRRLGRLSAGAAIASVTAGMAFANPGFAGLLAGALFLVNAGGGRLDVEASAPGRLVCDMGAFGRHFHVRAERDGCTFLAAKRRLRTIMAKDGRDRAAYLVSHRIEPGTPGKAN